MDNVNGALAFKATLDIDDFNVSAQSMERHIRQVSDTAITESAKMENSIQSFAQNGAKYIVSTLVGMGMQSLLQSIVQTRGQFQQLEIAFETMLGSATKGTALMNQLVDTAARTPFDLLGVAGGAKQLLAYGESAEKVNDTLIRLGNIASGLSIPLGDIVYLYGTTMTQGRLYAQDMNQFTGRGIPMVKELAKILNVAENEVKNLVSEGKIGFPEVQQVIMNLTNQGGMFFNLMEKQSKSLTGMLSNLGDAWDSALNKIGTENQDIFAGAISGAINVVENFDEVLRIIEAITVAYGSYKAAIVLNTLATKGYTGVALLDNTARQAKISLMKLEAVATGQVSAQTKAMTAAQEAHTISLQKQLTAEELLNLQKQLRISTIASLLTAQQQEYLSNLGLTTSSQGYEAAAMGVLSVEQQLSLRKTDLTAKSAVYRAALEQEVARKTQSQAATLAKMRADVKAAAVSVESSKQTAIATMQATEAARYELYWARKGGDATRIAIAEKKLEAAQENQALARKSALASQTDFYAKKKLLEATATRQSTAASVTDTAAKGAQTATTSMLSAMTTKATLAMKTLWATMKANPIGWILTLVGMVISAFTLFHKREEEVTDATGEFQDATKKEIDNLNLLFAVLKNAEKGTKTHKDVLEKINSVCKEYNKTLLDENVTLDKQKQKYDELTKAIQNSTAEKVKAKWIEQAMQKVQKSQSDSLKKLQESASNAKYYSHSSYTPYGNQSVFLDSKNIQNASGAVWDMVEVEALETANKLKGLTGQAYTDFYNQSLNRIVSYVKASTRATDAEMGAFKTNLNKYLTEVVNSSQNAQKEISKIDEQLAAFLAPKTTPVKESVDYVSMSFADLDKIVSNTQEEIDKLNSKKVKVETDTTKLNELQVKLNLVNKAIVSKTDNLNTEASLSARIQQLKEERENVVINSSRYKELTKTISALEDKMPKHLKTENAAKKAEQLSRKQIEMDRKLEDDRISVMEEGYAKRLAILELQHKQNLIRIDQEEKDLAEARKDAGKRGLSQTEKEGFSERRNLENQSFEKGKNKLFDDEIDYRKKQYALYYRWVENMGKDVADAHFKNLLSSGSSFSAWVNNEIARLEQKKAQNPSSFSTGDSENLFSLQIQRDEITGKKSAMDQFKESISKAIGEAANLAEKIEAIAEAKKKLEDGGFKLNPDEKLAATNELDQMDIEAKKELNESILNDFKSYEEKKNEIMANYSAMRLANVVKNNNELLDRLNKGEQKALSALQAEQLKSSEDWEKLFTDLDILTASEIEKLISNIEKQMADSDLKLSPIDYQALMDSLNKAKEKIVELNPFKALGSAFDNYIEATKKLKQAEKDNLSPTEINKLKKEAQNSAKSMTKSIASINDTINSVGASMSGLMASFGNDRLAGAITNVTDVLAGAGQTAMGVGQIMSGDILGGVTSVVGGITSVVGVFNKMHDARHERRIKRLQNQIDELALSYDNLGDAVEKSYSTEKAHLLEEQNKNLEEQNKKIRKQIEEEKSKKKADKERIKEWEETIRENEKEIAENTKYHIVEAIMGTDIASAIDEFANAYADAWAKGEKAAGHSADVVKNLIRTAIIEQLKNKLKPEVEEFMKYMSEALEDGIISEAEENMINRYSDALEKKSDDYLKKNEKWLKDEEEDPLRGAVRSMSEETGGVIAGRLNAFTINQAEQTAVLRDNLMYNAQIAQNTYVSSQRLTEIEATLKRIETKDNSLLSQGIE